MGGWDPENLPEPRAFQVQYGSRSLEGGLVPWPQAIRSGVDECFVCRIEVKGPGGECHAAMFSISGVAVERWTAAHGEDPDPDRVLDWYRSRLDQHLDPIMGSPEPETLKLYWKVFVSEDLAGAPWG